MPLQNLPLSFFGTGGLDQLIEANFLEAALLVVLPLNGRGEFLEAQSSQVAELDGGFGVGHRLRRGLQSSLPGGPASKFRMHKINKNIVNDIQNKLPQQSNPSKI